jgi:hypothetical protein
MIVYIVFRVTTKNTVAAPAPVAVFSNERAVRDFIEKRPGKYLNYQWYTYGVLDTAD